MPKGGRRSGAKILEAPYIVTMDAQRRVLKGGALLVEGNAISAVGSRDELWSRAPGAERLVFDRHVLLPGFIDCHEHASQMLGRGLADDVDEVTVRWGWDRIYPWEAILEEEDVYTGALLTAVELVRNGVTCFADPGGFLMDPVAKAVADPASGPCSPWAGWIRGPRDSRFRRRSFTKIPPGGRLAPPRD